MSSLLVMKFGGTSLADHASLRQASRHIAARFDAGFQLVVIVSAMGRETDRLSALANTQKECLEKDVVLSAGEQVSAGLLALDLQKKNYDARSFLGWQIPIETDNHYGKAQITNINIDNIQKALSRKQIAVVAGFQGVSPENHITTLGRGGSDISAVALAAALGAKTCEIFTDVEGVFTADPRIIAKSHLLRQISYEEMVELAAQGAQVLQTRSVELAAAHHISLKVLPAYGEVGIDCGTQICAEEKIGEKIMEQRKVSGVACSNEEAKITLSALKDKPGVAALVFSPLAHANILVDMIAQTSAGDDGKTDITFTLAQGDLSSALDILENARADIGYEKLSGDKNVAKISVVGIGMRSHIGIAETMFSTLAKANINIQAISTSEIKISVLVARDEMEKAARLLHTAYGLDR